VNILDQNIPVGQRQLLRNRRIAVRHIGFDLGRPGMKDREIIPLLHSLDRPTLFTLDVGFSKRRLCHPGYCLVYLNIAEEEAAEFVRRTLRHRELNTRAKRMGAVVRVQPAAISLWRLHANQLIRLSW
jgi:hypothetical protein